MSALSRPAHKFESNATPALSKLLSRRRQGKSPDPLWRPELYDATEASQAEAIVALIEKKPNLFIHDTIYSQLCDLCETRHPERKLTREEIDAWVKIHLGDCPIDAYGTWAYYPWSERLIHILPRDEFVELRTNRNKYKITEEEQEILGSKRIGVVGLSVGQSVSLTLALERGFKEIRLADFDTLELSNLNRIRTGLHNLGEAKVHITAREIAEIDPYFEVSCFPAGISADNIEDFLFEGGKLDVIIDECDSIDVKFHLREVAKRHGIPVVMDTSDRGMIDIERFDLEPGRPIFHGLAKEVDIEALSSLSTGEKIPFVMDIVGIDTLSDRLRASMIEVEESISTWPQLATSVVSGGAMTADVVRRIFLQQIHDSGRYFADIESIIPNTTSAQEKPLPPVRVQTGNEVDEAIAISQRLQFDGDSYQIAPSKETVEQLVRQAILAPSGGNNQPWIWIFEREHLTLHLDTSKISPFTDFLSSGSLASLGAATENLLLSAPRHGLRAEAHSVSREAHPNCIAKFSFFEAGTSPVSRLAEFIPARHTNRQIASRVPLESHQLENIRQAIDGIEGAQMQFVTDPEALSQLGELVGRADRLRFLNRAFNRELFNELCLDGYGCLEGIALDTLELSPVDQVGISVCRHWPSLDLIRQWNLGRKLVHASHKAVASASAMGLIVMPGAKPSDYFNGGRALQRAWLAATEAGISFWPMTILPYLFARLVRGGGEALSEMMIDELLALRKVYTRLFDVGDANGEVMLFRLAVAPPASARSPRRPVRDVLHFIN